MANDLATTYLDDRCASARWAALLPTTRQRHLGCAGRPSPEQRRWRRT